MGHIEATQRRSTLKTNKTTACRQCIALVETLDLKMDYKLKFYKPNEPRVSSVRFFK